MSGSDALRKELVRLIRGDPVVDSAHWPPQDEDDGLAWCLWVDMGKPDLPENRPLEGAVSYLLTLKLAEIYEKEQDGGLRRRSRNRDGL